MYRPGVGGPDSELAIAWVRRQMPDPERGLASPGFGEQHGPLVSADAYITIVRSAPESSASGLSGGSRGSNAGDTCVGAARGCGTAAFARLVEDVPVGRGTLKDGL